MKTEFTGRMRAGAGASGAYCTLASLLTVGKPTSIKPKHVRLRQAHITGQDVHEVPFIYKAASDLDAEGCSHQAHVFYGASGLSNHVSAPTRAPLSTLDYVRHAYRPSDQSYQRLSALSVQGCERPSSLHALIKAYRPSLKFSVFISPDFLLHMVYLGLQPLWASELAYFKAQGIYETQDDRWSLADNTLALMWCHESGSTLKPPSHWWLMHNKGLNLYDPLDGSPDHSWGALNIDPLTYHHTGLDQSHSLNGHRWSGLALCVSK